MSEFEARQHQAGVEARNRATSKRQLEGLRTAQRDVLYLSGDKRTLATWIGEHAMNVHKLTASQRRGFYGVRHTLYYLTAQDIHGHWWTGTSPGPMMYARMRRMKGR